MNTSTHYELKLYEGSDTFNPLNVDVSNFEDIDEALYDNYLMGVGGATELLNDTVHAITRTDATSVFHFTATANWTAGDTVTVDGVQVTAKLPSGQPLGTGAYVINSEVLCILNGTLLTVFVPAGGVTTADNALKLGGELPEYYGTASAVSSAASVANAASTLVQSLNTAVTTLITGTLVAGSTSVTISSASINDNSIIDEYFYSALGETVEPVNYATKTVASGSITYTFAERESNLTIGVRVINP